MEFLSEYGLFLLKTITIVVGVLIVVGTLISAGQKHKQSHDGRIKVTNLSEELRELADDVRHELLSKEAFKALMKERKKEDKQKAKDEKKKLKEKKKTSNPEETAIADKATTKGASTDEEKTDSSSDQPGRLFVLDFDGDVEASEVENLREEITAIVSVAEKNDEILLRLESPGGMVHSYGLAASQLMRIKDKGLKLTIAVDEVAASGGYMMACVADRIVSAPFAVVGSIGVVAEMPNFHQLLKKHEIEYEQHTAGDYKRTLTMFGQNTPKGRRKFQEELEETHVLFKQFITENRAKLDIEKVATGEHWYGRQAVELGLVDEIRTSDDFILSAASEREVYQVEYEIKKPLTDKLSLSFHRGLEKQLMNLWQKLEVARLFKR